MAIYDYASRNEQEAIADRISRGMGESQITAGPRRSLWSFEFVSVDVRCPPS